MFSVLKRLTMLDKKLENKLKLLKQVWQKNLLTMFLFQNTVYLLQNKKLVKSYWITFQKAEVSFQVYSHLHNCCRYVGVSRYCSQHNIQDIHWQKLRHRHEYEAVVSYNIQSICQDTQQHRLLTLTTLT